MNGCVITGTPIAVDIWHLRKVPQARLFFLSHMHTDHTSGLRSSWKYPIYCSEISGKMLQHKFGISSHLIHPLEVNTSHIVPLDDLGDQSVTVYVIDANHCPGAVMFLFQGYFGKILYTGDFRYTADMFSDKLHGLYIDVDILYLDNTFCNPACDFPSRAECCNVIKSIIKNHLGHHIKFSIHSLGKEELLEELALYFKTWIVVSPKRYDMLKILQRRDVFTTDPSHGFIHLVEDRITRQKVEKWNEDHPTIVIMATARFTGRQDKPFLDEEGVYIVPYSDHSSYSELSDFVSRVKPKRIIPIVSSAHCDMRLFKGYLDCSVQREVVVPQWIQKLPYGHETGETRKKFKGRPERKPVHKKKAISKGVVFDSHNSPLKTDKVGDKRDGNVTEFESQANEADSVVREIQDTPFTITGGTQHDDAQVMSSDSGSYVTCATHSDDDGEFETSTSRSEDEEDACNTVVLFKETNGELHSTKMKHNNNQNTKNENFDEQLENNDADIMDMDTLCFDNETISAEKFMEKPVLCEVDASENIINVSYESSVNQINESKSDSFDLHFGCSSPSHMSDVNGISHQNIACDHGDRKNCKITHCIEDVEDWLGISIRKGHVSQQFNHEEKFTALQAAVDKFMNS